MFFMLGSHDREKREGTIREWKIASHLPARGGTIPHLAIPGQSQAFLTIFTLLPEGSYCISRGCELQGDQSETRSTWLTGYSTPLSMK